MTSFLYCRGVVPYLQVGQASTQGVSHMGRPQRSEWAHRRRSGFPPWWATCCRSVYGSNDGCLSILIHCVFLYWLILKLSKWERLSCHYVRSTCLLSFAADSRALHPPLQSKWENCGESGPLCGDAYLTLPSLMLSSFSFSYSLDLNFALLTTLSSAFHFKSAK